MIFNDLGKYRRIGWIVKGAKSNLTLEIYSHHVFVRKVCKVLRCHNNAQ